MVETTAAANTIAQFGSKLDTFKDVLNTTIKAQNKTLDTKLEAQNVVLASQLEAQNNRMAFMQWLMGLAFPLLIFLVGLMAWLSRTGAPPMRLPDMSPLRRLNALRAFLYAARVGQQEWCVPVRNDLAAWGRDGDRRMADGKNSPPPWPGLCNGPEGNVWWLP